MDLDLSLDEIITKTGKSNVRRRNERRRSSVQRRNNNGITRPRQRGTPLPDKIMVSNLAKTVTQEDIRTLFGRIGALASVQMNFDSNGRPKGTASVTYVKPMDAWKAIKEYHKRPLDNIPMMLELVYKVNSSNTQGLIVPRRRERNNGIRPWRRKRSHQQQPKTQEDLNAEMDDYMNNNNSMDVVNYKSTSNNINTVLDNALD